MASVSLEADRQDRCPRLVCRERRVRGEDDALGPAAARVGGGWVGGVAPHLFDVGEAFLFGALETGLVPAEGVGAGGGPEGVLLGVVFDHLVDGGVFGGDLAHAGRLLFLGSSDDGDGGGEGLGGQEEHRQAMQHAEGAAGGVVGVEAGDGHRGVRAHGADAEVDEGLGGGEEDGGEEEDQEWRPDAAELEGEEQQRGGQGDVVPAGEHGPDDVGGHGGVAGGAEGGAGGEHEEDGAAEPEGGEEALHGGSLS